MQQHQLLSISSHDCHWKTRKDRHGQGVTFGHGGWLGRGLVTCMSGFSSRKEAEKGQEGRKEVREENEHEKGETGETGQAGQAGREAGSLTPL